MLAYWERKEVLQEQVVPQYEFTHLFNTGEVYDPIRTVSISPDDDAYVLSLSMCGYAKIWDIKDKQEAVLSEALTRFISDNRGDIIDASFLVDGVRELDLSFTLKSGEVVFFSKSRGNEHNA